MLGKFAQTDKKDDKSRDVCKQIAAFQCIKYDRYFLLPFGAAFFGEWIVSTVVVLGRFFASLTGINSPVFASLPIFLSLDISITPLITARKLNNFCTTYKRR